MPNPKRKSIAELITRKPLSNKPSSAEIDKITQKIHEPVKPATIQPLPVAEKTKKISVNTPISLYLEVKTKSILQEQTLNAYIISLIEQDLKKKNGSN